VLVRKASVFDRAGLRRIARDFDDGRVLHGGKCLRVSATKDRGCAGTDDSSGPIRRAWIRIQWALRLRICSGGGEMSMFPPACARGERPSAPTEGQGG